MLVLRAQKLVLLQVLLTAVFHNADSALFPIFVAHLQRVSKLPLESLIFTLKLIIAPNEFEAYHNDQSHTHGHKCVKGAQVWLCVLQKLVFVYVLRRVVVVDWGIGLSPRPWVIVDVKASVDQGLNLCQFSFYLLKLLLLER